MVTHTKAEVPATLWVIGPGDGGGDGGGEDGGYDGGGTVAATAAAASAASAAASAVSVGGATAATCTSTQHAGVSMCMRWVRGAQGLGRHAAASGGTRRTRAVLEEG
jgi:hypothetical protein